MADAAPIPQPLDGDDEDVHWALSTAAALWGRGERAEALKWLRRAAEQASDANADTRALQLFKAAADVATMVGSQAPPPSASVQAPAKPPSDARSAPPAQPARSEQPAARVEPQRRPEQRSEPKSDPQRQPARPASSSRSDARTSDARAASRSDARASDARAASSQRPAPGQSPARASPSAASSNPPQNLGRAAVQAHVPANVRVRTTEEAVPSTEMDASRAAPHAAEDDDLKTGVRSAAELADAIRDGLVVQATAPDAAFASPLATSLAGPPVDVPGRRVFADDEVTMQHSLGLISRPDLGEHGPGPQPNPIDEAHQAAAEARAPQPTASVPATAASPQIALDAAHRSQGRARFEDLDEETRVLDEPPEPAIARPAEPARSEGNDAQDATHDSLPKSQRARDSSRPRPEKPKMPSVPAVMVGVLPGSKTGEARVIVLEPGSMPPEGAAMAILVPMSALDGDALAQLFRMALPDSR